MLTFTAFTNLLTERILSIGLNPNHEKFREQHRQEIHDILLKSYKNVDGGYGGLGTGDEASKAIHDDISNSIIKATKRDGKITAVALYKPKFGRKAIALGTDGTKQGKKDFHKTALEDNEQRRAWGEFSGKPKEIFKTMGYPIVPNTKAAKLTGKEVHLAPDDDEQYTRMIGGQPHTKTIMGHPQD